jgi:dTDP-4-amino-4,6-dideoxygalactose transaminase
MPNLNAALGCAQMERLEEILMIKVQIADQWDTFFYDRDVDFVKGINGTNANHWLNAIILDSRLDRDEFLKMTNDNNVMTRPIWTLMSKLPMFKNCQTDGLENSLWLEDRVVNIPSSVPDGALKKLDK